MKVNVRVIPNAKKNEVLEEENKLKIYLRAPAKEGKANKALIEILAEFFKVKKGNIRVIKGGKSRDKVVEIVF